MLLIVYKLHYTDRTHDVIKINHLQHILDVHKTNDLKTWEFASYWSNIQSTFNRLLQQFRIILYLIYFANYSLFSIQKMNNIRDHTSCVNCGVQSVDACGRRDDERHGELGGGSCWVGIGDAGGRDAGLTSKKSRQKGLGKSMPTTHDMYKNSTMSCIKLLGTNLARYRTDTMDQQWRPQIQGPVCAKNCRCVLWRHHEV